MAMERYNPTARASSRQMPSNGATPGNLGQGDPVNGYPFGSTTPGYIDYRDPSVNGAFYPGTTRQRYQDDPNARKVHTPGSDRHSQEEKYFGREIGGVGPAGPPVEWNSGFYDQQHAGDVQRKRELLAGNDPYQKAKAAGDLKGQIAAMTALRGQMQEQRWIDQGGTEETYRNRFNRDWPKPRSPLGAYSHGPGSADWDTRFTNPPPPNTIGGGVRRGATPQVNAPMSGGMPPSQNPMFEGYQGGGAGVPSGGSGNWGPAGGRPVSDLMYVPGRDGPAIDSGWWNQGGRPVVPQGGGAGTVSGGQGGQFGGLQNWMAQAGGYNPGASTGSAGLYNDASLYDSPMAAQGRTAPWQGTAPGGRQPIGPFNPTIDPSTRPGSAPSWASAQPGYAPFNPGNFSMPYDTGGMWQMFGGSPMGGGMNYAQMQNYLGLQPQGAPNWIGL